MVYFKGERGIFLQLFTVQYLNKLINYKLHIYFKLFLIILSIT